MKNFWYGKKILLTGGAGFLGSHIAEILKAKGVTDIFIPRSKEYDLRKGHICRKLVKGTNIIIHAAGNVGGIGYNRDKPGELFYDNLIMGAQLMEEARKSKVDKFVALGTICAYPKYTPVPFKEENLWNGYPEETNAPYGLAKKMLLVQAQAYRQQYGMNIIFLLPVNLYGPGDNFNPNSSHVIPALIKKFIDAKELGMNQVVVWGTGKATREFFYVDDCAKAVILATERYNKPDPVNVGSCFEISIKSLANLIRDITEFKGKIIWDATKPDGQPRRKLDTSKAAKEFGFISKTSFEKGLKKTINWYLHNR